MPVRIEISESGHAPTNDPAIFALALVAAHGMLEVVGFDDPAPAVIADFVRS